MDQGQTEWTEKERAAFAPQERLLPSEWAEKYRVLPSSMAAEAGPYRLARTPYLRGIMDAIVDRTITEICILKAAQVGYSECVRNMLGYAIDSDPGPCLMVMPSEDAAREMVDERIRPLLETTPQLAKHLTGKLSDNTKGGIKLDTMSIYLGWAGSPNSLSSKPCKIVYFDEVDKYPNFSGREADPISLGRVRTTTYQHRGKIVIGSTPTTRQGHIWRAWEGCGVQLDYHCPCTICGEFQQMVWTQVKWAKLSEDKQQLADMVEQQRLAYYECIRCKGAIGERHKARMVEGGVWLSEGQQIASNGKISGERPVSKRVGFRVPGILSPWISFSGLAAEGLRAMGDSAKMMHFKNSFCAEVFEERVSGIKTDEVRQRAEGAIKSGIVPAWAAFCIASVDVQKDCFYAVIRAWGHNYKSHLVWHGQLISWGEVEKLLTTPIHQEDSEAVTPVLMVIDTGYRSTEVYEFASKDSRIIPIKGSDRTQPISLSKAAYAYGVSLRYIGGDYFKDRLATYRADPERWMVNGDITEDYCQQLASEHKVVIRGKGGTLQEKWVKQSANAANHYFDCEAYQIVGADLAGVAMLPPDDQIIGNRIRERQQRQSVYMKDRGRAETWLGNTSGWLSK